MSAKQMSEEKRKARLKLEVSSIVPEGNLEDVLARFRKVQQMEFALEEVGFKDADLVALGGSAASKLHILRFGEKSADTGVIAAVARAAGRVERFIKLKVKGMNSEGLEQVVSIDDVPERLGSADYDAWVRDLALNSSDWGGSILACEPIKRLLNLATKPKIMSLLEAPIEPP